MPGRRGATLHEYRQGCRVRELALALREREPQVRWKRRVLPLSMHSPFETALGCDGNWWHNLAP